jgi:hypothetical protein
MTPVNRSLLLSRAKSLTMISSGLTVYPKTVIELVGFECYNR